jgi:hypothetical protein
VVKLVEDAALGRDADLLELFETDRTFVNEELGKLYGIPVKGATLVAARHPASVPRAGLLTAAGLLAMHDKQHETSPTRRGAAIQETFLCAHIPEPPPNVDVNLKELPPGTIASRRRILSQHSEDPSCAGCHALMDPLGLALENFDALGVYRVKEENGLTIDPSGTLEGKAFSGPRALGALVRQDPRARDCLVRRTYRYAIGQHEGEQDAARLHELGKAFESGGHRYGALLLALVASDGFTHVSVASR